MRWAAILMLVVGCRSPSKVRPPADAARAAVVTAPLPTPFLAVVTSPDNGLAPACVDGELAPALAELAPELDCRRSVAGYRDAIVRGHHVVLLLDATGDLRGRFDGQPLDKIRLGEGPALAAFPPAALRALADAELGGLLSTLAGVAMIAPGRRIGYTAAALQAMRAEWPAAAVDPTPPRVVVDDNQRRLTLWYELDDPPGCRELWRSDVWIDRDGAIDQLTYRLDRHGETCPVPPPDDPDRKNIFPD